MEKFIKLVGANVDSDIAGYSFNVSGAVYVDTFANEGGGSPAFGRTRVYYDDGNFVQINLASSDLGTEIVNSTTTSATANKLNDTGVNFNTVNASTPLVGKTVYNTSDGTTATITAIDGDNVLSISADIMANAETYIIADSSQVFVLAKALSNAIVEVNSNHWRDNVLEFNPPVEVDAVAATW